MTTKFVCCVLARRMQETDSGIKPRYGFVKLLLIALLLCNVAYFSSKAFNGGVYVEIDASADMSDMRVISTTDNSSRDKISTTPSGPGDGSQGTMAAVYLERKRHLHEVCDYKRLSWNATYLGTIPRVLTVDIDHPLLYCPVQKAASSFWVRLFSALSSKGKISSPYQITLENKKLTSFRQIERDLVLSKASPEQINEQKDSFMANLFSFMFVRDPYARLFSAYVDKVYYPNILFWPKLINEIIDEVRVNKTHMTFLGTVTFEEFIKYILKLHEEGEELDKHFAPMHTLCDPCAIEYDFLGKLETFVPDTEYLLDMWRRTFNDINLTFSDFSDETMLDDTKRHVPMIFLAIEVMVNKSSTKDIYTVLSRGWSNLKLRGYIDKGNALPFTRDEVRHVTVDSYMNAILKITSSTPISSARAKQQRSDALLQAYQTIGAEDLEKLRLFVLQDCKLFGYDDRPQKIFNRENPVSQYNYFPDV